MTIGSQKISIYKNVFDTQSQYTITIDDALSRIKNGKSAQAIITIRNEPDENRQSNLKNSLPSVTFSGIFKERIDEAMISHSGFICLDFDNVNVTEYKEKFKQWEHSYATWTSPRGNGVKVLLRIANPKKHREHFAALIKLYPNTDAKCANESRVCYESYDPEIYINREAKVFTQCLKIEVVETKKVSNDIFEVYRKLITWTEGSTKTDKSFHQGNRNYFVYVMAGAMCRFGISEESASQLIVSDYSQNDFTKKEIERAIRNAYKKNNTSYGTAEFSNGQIRTKETLYEINPQILEEGFNLDDVIYGSDVYEGAVNIYEKGYTTAETTHIPKLDEFFKFKRGELTVLSGIGNYGKSNYLYQLLLIKSYFDGIKWAIFSPEHTPAEEFYFDFTEMLLGCRADGGATDKPSKDLFDKAYEFVSQHFFYVFPTSIMPSPEYIKTKFMELILKEGVGGVLIDPFNQLANDWEKKAGRTDKYLETFLADLTMFGQKNNLFNLLICHPHKMQKDGTGNYPCPDVYDLADGAMWSAKATNILVYHRPVAQTDPENPMCEHHSKKIKRQKQVGKKGMFEFELARKKRRFYFDGFNPLDGNRFDANYSPQQPQYKIEGNPNLFIESRTIDDNENAPF
jgi:hypothetical protein